MGLLNFDYEDNPLKLGLLMAGLRMATGGPEAGAEGFAQGFNTGLLGKRSRQAKEKEDYELRDRIAAAKEAEGLDLNNAQDVARFMMRHGSLGSGATLLNTSAVTDRFGKPTTAIDPETGLPTKFLTTGRGDLKSLGFDPAAVKEGQYTSFQGGAPQSNLVPGYTTAVSDTAAAKKAAEEEQKLQEIQTSGGPKLVKPAEFRALSNQPPLPPLGGRGLPPIPMGGVTTNFADPEAALRAISSLPPTNPDRIAIEKSMGNVNMGSAEPSARILSGTEIASKKAEAEASVKNQAEARKTLTEDLSGIEHTRAMLQSAMQGITSKPEFDERGELKKSSIEHDASGMFPGVRTSFYEVKNPQWFRDQQAVSMENAINLLKKMGGNDSNQDVQRALTAGGLDPTQNDAATLHRRYRALDDMLVRRMTDKKRQAGQDLPPGARAQASPVSRLDELRKKHGGSP